MTRPYNSEQPTESAAQHVKEFAEAARAAASEFFLTLHVQHSLASHSAYLRVQRGRSWAGLRISDHPPVHSSSADFEQLLIPVSEVMTDDFRAQATYRIRHWLRHGRAIVASPEETDEAVRNCFLTASGKTRRRMPSTHEICLARHQLNVRARWTWEIEQGAD